MSTSINVADKERLRLEIAILQEDVKASNPGTAKFKIPIIMTDMVIGQTVISNTILSKSNLRNTSVNISNTVDLFIPTEYTYFYGTDIVPKGTRFIVAFIGGNVNDIKIIGRYDNKGDIK